MSDISDFLKSIKDGTASESPVENVSMGNPILDGIVTGGVPGAEITLVYGLSNIGRQSKYQAMISRLKNDATDQQVDGCILALGGSNEEIRKCF
jgi:hypothetical protein